MKKVFCVLQKSRVCLHLISVRGNYFICEIILFLLWSQHFWVDFYSDTPGWFFGVYEKKTVLTEGNLSFNEKEVSQEKCLEGAG